jgi:hypothetical protein
MTLQSGAPPATDRARRRWAIAAVVILVLVVALLVAALMLRDDRDGAASGTASPAIPTASDAAASATLPASASAAPSAEAPISDEWIASATFSEPGRRYVAGDLAAWSDGLLAVGTWYESEDRGAFGPPPAHQGRVWRSTDGTEWADATPGGTFDQVELQHLLETADGALIVIGDRWTGQERTSAAWATTDGESWESVVLDGVPADAWLARVVTGPKGHLAAAWLGNEAQVLYSADGRQWDATVSDVSWFNDLGAGDEGFVASIIRGDPNTSASEIVASSDGLEWFDATAPADGAARVAPRGGDWFAATTSVGENVSVAAWESADGLEWSPLGDLTLGSFESADATCTEGPWAIHGLPGLMVMGTTLFGPCGEGAVVAAGSSYTSPDGVEWTQLPFGDQAFAAAAASVGDRVIVVTDTRTGFAENVGVVFWIGPAP